MKRESAAAAVTAVTAAVQCELTESSPADTTDFATFGNGGTVPESNGAVQNHPIAATRVRVVNSNGFVVYTRNKRLKSSADGGGLVKTDESNDGEMTSLSGDVEQDVEGISMDNSESVSQSMHGRDEKPSVEGGNGTVSRGKSVIKESKERKGKGLFEVEVRSAEYLVRSREQINKILNKKDDDDNITVKQSGKSVNGSVSEGVLVTKDHRGTLGKSEMVEIEVKEQPNAVESRRNVQKRIRRPVFKLREENNNNTVKMNVKGFKEVMVMEAKEVDNVRFTPPKKIELDMVKEIKANEAETDTESSKKIEIKGRPTTVLELFETGLLEGYPVFYNAGKRGIMLSGTVKDIGILCFCNICQGGQAIPPSQFEIHAVKTYKRASQYICLENGKSLLDVVKECRKFSLKTMEESIQNFIGPVPVKESIVCRSCKESFLATLAGMDQVCDACVIHIRRETNAIQSWRANNSVHTNYVNPSLEAFKSYPRLDSSKSSQKRKGRAKKKRKFSELSLDKDFLGRSSLHIAGRKKRSQLEILDKFPKPAFVPLKIGSESVHRLPNNNLPEKTFNRSPLYASTPYSSTNASMHISAMSMAQWKITKKDQRMHSLVFEEGGLPDGAELAYYARGKKLLEGYKKGEGIFCSCCNTEVSPSQFEAHAGWASRRKPYAYIYTSDGMSLHEFALTLAKGWKYSSGKEKENVCVICSDGGELVYCDGCPRSFHKECASLSDVTYDKWYCKYCENTFGREQEAPGIEIDDDDDDDPVDEDMMMITNKCTRIMKTPEEAEIIACVICRGYDFSKSGFGPRTVILCEQCEREYHVGCLKKSKIADLKELPKGKWFCSMECKSICSELQDLLISGEEKLPDSCLDPIKVKQNGSQSNNNDFDVRWRLLSGKVANKESKILLSQAVNIFHDCFEPIIDSATGRDFIPSMVYGRNIRGQDFGGMCCAVLTVNSSVVSAGIIRIFGQHMAELPLVATRIGDQGKGYFQLLFSYIEKLLASLNVRRLVLPDTDESASIWTNKFGFRKIPSDQLINYRKACWQMVGFEETCMLEKMVPKFRIINQDDQPSSLDHHNIVKRGHSF